MQTVKDIQVKWCDCLNIHINHAYLSVSECMWQRYCLYMPLVCMLAFQCLHIHYGLHFLPTQTVFFSAQLYHQYIEQRQRLWQFAAPRPGTTGIMEGSYCSMMHSSCIRFRHKEERKSDKKIVRPNTFDCATSVKKSECKK